MTYIDTDVLIIGSGFGAAAPALRLAQAGFRVVMVEKGPRIDPLRDFRQTQDPKYLLRYLKGLSGDHLNLTYAEALGGGSGFYEMVSLRAPRQAFAQVDHNGAQLWPAQLDRATMDPYYDIAEQMLSVEQIAPHEVPKSGLVFAQMMKNLGYSCERARYAVRGCLGSGFCITGCIYGAKQSLLLNYLPQAVEAGITAISRLVQGYGYDITGADVWAAYQNTVKAAEYADRGDEVRQRLGQLLDRYGRPGDLAARPSRRPCRWLNTAPRPVPGSAATPSKNRLQPRIGAP